MSKVNKIKRNFWRARKLDRLKDHEELDPDSPSGSNWMFDEEDPRLNAKNLRRPRGK